MVSYTHHFATMAATFTGNRGAEAMLLATIERLRSRFPLCCIHVLSYSPAHDREWLAAHPISGVLIHDARPKHLVTEWLPKSLVSTVLKSSPPLLAEHNQNIPALLKVDAVFDLAGVSFIDGREKFLPFNVLTLVPFLMNKVPVYKLSQAIGPITSFPNRIAAKLVLPHCKRVVARGSETFAHLQSFGLGKNLRSAPDVAFLLRPPSPSLIPGEQRPIDVGLIPSSVVSRKHPDYSAFMVEVIQNLQQRGFSVSLIAHSWMEGTNKEFNNDLPLIERILDGVPQREAISLYGPGLDARALKATISKHKVVITSRFHGMIAALDSATVPLVMGWSHKYREVLGYFGFEDFALPTGTTSVRTLVERTSQALGEIATLSSRLEAQLARVRKDAQNQFDDICDEIEGVQASLKEAS